MILVARLQVKAHGYHLLPMYYVQQLLLRLPVLVDFICTSLTRTRVVLNECAPSFHSIHFPSSRTYTGVRSCFVILSFRHHLSRTRD